MYLAIPSSGPTVDDPVDTRFGRAPYFLIVHTETNETEFVSNPYAADSGGVGPRVVQMLVQKGVTDLIAPQIGGHADNALVAAGIRVYLWEGAGTVSSALEMYRAGRLSLMAGKSGSS